MGSARRSCEVSEPAQVHDLEHPDHPLGWRGRVGRTRPVARGVQSAQRVAPVGRCELTATRRRCSTTRSWRSSRGFNWTIPPAFTTFVPHFPRRVETFQSGASARLTFDLTPSMRVTSLSAFRNAGLRRRCSTSDVSELDLDRLARARDPAPDVRGADDRVAEPASDVDRRRVPLRRSEPRCRHRSSCRDPARVPVRTRASMPTRARSSDRPPFGLTPRVSSNGGPSLHPRTQDDRQRGWAVHRRCPQSTLLPGSAYNYTDAISHDAWTPKFGVEMRARETRAGVRVRSTRIQERWLQRHVDGGRAADSRRSWRGVTKAGFKADLRDGRARLNVAAFYTDYTDLQVQTTIRPELIEFSNAAEATIRGVELEATDTTRRQRPAGGHVAWLDARVRSIRCGRRRRASRATSPATR